MLELLSLSSMVVAWLVPNHYPPWTSFYNEACAGLSVLLLVLALGRRNLSRPTPKITWALLGVATIPWLQWCVGLLQFSGDAVVSSLYLIGLAAAVASGHAWAESDRRAAAAALAAATLFGAIASALLGIAQAVNAIDSNLWLEAMASPDGRATANLGQPNNLATLIGFGVLGLLYLRERGLLSRGLAAFVAVVLLTGAAATQSRTPLLFGVVITMGWWWAGTSRSVPLHTRASTVAIFAVIHWLLVAAWFQMQQTTLLVPRHETIMRQGGAARLEMWRILVDASTHSPWWGFGFLQVGEAQLSVTGRHPHAVEFWMHGHNLFLELVLWCGYPVGLLLGVLVVCWFVSRVRRVANTEALIGILVVALFGTHALLELPHHYLYFLVPVGFWLGIIEQSTDQTAWLSARWNLLPAALGVILGLGVCWSYPAIEEDFRLVRFENKRIGSLYSDRFAPDAPFLSSLTAYLRFSRIEPTPGMTARDLKFLAAVAQRYAYAASLYRLSRALALNDQLAAAIKVLEQLRLVHGDGNLQRLHENLLELIAEGQVGLTPLEQAVSNMLLIPPQQSTVGAGEASR